MKAFMDANFLLSSHTAAELYHSSAASCPIIDYHCHIDPREIAENQKYENLAELWLAHDHYKWRQMRSNGVDEFFITGEAPPFEKFQKYAETLERAPGNPLYHWSHLELQRYFDYDGVLSAGTAKEVWDHCSGVMRDKRMDTESIVAASGVAVICTTDDPVDDLRHHAQVQEAGSFPAKVFPAFRPDRIVNIEADQFGEYLGKLETLWGGPIDSFEELKNALSARLNHFHQHGCKVSDHGLHKIPYAPAPEQEVERIFGKRKKDALTAEETAKYKTAILLFLGAEYEKRGWVMQLHMGALRDNNHKMFRRFGADAGFDCIGPSIDPLALTAFLDALCQMEALPKTILYSLNPGDNAAIGTIIGCFQEGDARGKLQHGSAWWFNDHKTGMREQLISLANLGLLGNFIGMTTDSRSFLSYVRHDYFRRILCDLVGDWVEAGELAADRGYLKRLISDISFGNASGYFGFSL